MKLSLCWLGDHLAHKFQEVSLDLLIDTLNKKTAEIDSVKKIAIDASSFFVARIIKIELDTVVVIIDEIKKEVRLPQRKDSSLEGIYLIKKMGTGYEWATLFDIGSEKEGLFSQFWLESEDLKGNWRASFEAREVIFTLDNKSITHRPDLWGHRGFAREIGALFSLDLLPEEQLLAAEPIKHYETASLATQDNPYRIEIVDQVACSRLAGLALHSVSIRPSSLFIAVRLVRLDNRPINNIVDLTNYVMLDLSQPLHAFDAEKNRTKTFSAQRAGKDKYITLLDDTVIKLDPDDLVISDGMNPLALAGVMGGKESRVTADTHQVYIEAAHFSPAVIRAQAMRHKKRTEASARFEKNLDPNQNTQALLRYIKLLDLYRIPYVKSDVLVSAGALAHEVTLVVEHSFICQRLGVSLSPEIVESTLVSLGFGVSSCQQNKEILYTVIVPTFRSTKDVQKSEDIVEEVGRLYGYEKIPLQLSTRNMQPFSLHRVLTMRALKRLLAYGLQMREVQNYAFYDEDFLVKIGYQAHGAIELKNPVSEREKKLVTSLVPHLLKNIAVNVPQESAVSFFECNRIWKQQFSQHSLTESLSTAGIFFSRIAAVSFYEGKAQLEKLFSSLGLVVKWVKIDQDQLLPLYSQHETAELWVGEEKIGTAGKIDASTLARFTEGDAFIFELAADFLFRYHPEKKSFVPLAKYQDSFLDISMLAAYSLSVQIITDALAGADSRITGVSLIDFYEKKEWLDKRSITMRCSIRDEHKTLIKEEIDQVMQKIISVAHELGALVR